MPEQDADAKVRLAEQLWNDPETRPLMERAIVKKFPQAEAAMPHLALQKQLDAGMAKVDARLAEVEARERALSSQGALAVGRREVMADPVLAIREDELPAIEKIMVEETVGGHRQAAELYRSRQTVATPRGVFDFNAEVPGLRGAGGDLYKGIVENPDQWARDMAATILTDHSKGNLAKWM